MQPISTDDIRIRLQRDNPWWADPKAMIPEAAYPRRVYFSPFKALALNFDVRRATVLLGPRRVGKTVILKQLIHEAIDAGVVEPRAVLYASVDTPVYSGISLQTFLDLMPRDAPSRRLVIFDEIQYLSDWEVH